MTAVGASDAGAPPPGVAGAVPRRGPAAAALVALGIFVTRLFGLARSRAQAAYLGTSDVADALTAALRIPNLLQNLFGEGVLSASFIPVYARLLAEGDEVKANRVAGAVLGLLAAAVACLVALGVLAAPLLVDTITPGFDGAKRDLTVTLVRIVFPGTGLLVLSAWCLGILNSHRRFLLSYLAPVAWNLAIIGALVWGGVRRLPPPRAVELVAWWTVVGSLLQLLVQVPTVLRLTRGVRPALARASAEVRQVVRGFVPAFVARGAVQISAYIDVGLASGLGAGAASALAYAQVLYLLPVSLFGMSVSAAQLPAMAATIGATDEVHAALRRRLTANARQVAFFVVPSAVAFLALGDMIAAIAYQSGRFTRADSLHLWAVLAGSAVGLVATTVARLYSSTFYALKDTRTPLRLALVRITFSVAIGWTLAYPVRAALGLDERWGVAGLTLAGGVSGWIEFALLRARLADRIGASTVPAAFTARVWMSAVAAAAVAWGVKLVVGVDRPVLDGLLVAAAFGVVYLTAALVTGVAEARALAGRAVPSFRRVAGSGE